MRHRIPPRVALGWLATTGLFIVTRGWSAETHKVDAIHSSLLFRVKHANVGFFYGRFNEVGGTFVLDTENPANSKIDVEVKTDSVDTHNAMRDQHLKGPDFFDVQKFPLMTFKSKQVRKTGQDDFEVSGDFTLLNVTRPVTITVTHTGSGRDPFGAYRSGFETVFTIKRSEFGMTKMIPAVGDEVRLIISIEGVRQ